MTTTLTWINPNDTFLSQSQALNNAQIVADHFAGTDWTKESLSALCGNMWHESSINPSMHELGYGDSMSYGYGLVQWTPGTKLSDWCAANGLDYTLGDSQLARIDYEVNNNIQWIAKSTYGYTTFAQFRQNSGGWSVDYLTEMFMNCYERPAAATANLADRQSFANTAYTSLDWTGTGSGGGGGTPTPYHIQNKAAQYQYEEKGALGMYVQVKNGDNLSTIANRYGVSVDSIKGVSIHDIPNKDIIHVGDILLVPEKQAAAAPQPAATIKRYIVQKGDNLTKISLHLGVPISTLVTKNGIKDQDKIFVGQILKY
jgi:LysM repeat protein